MIWTRLASVIGFRSLFKIGILGDKKFLTFLAFFDIVNLLSGGGIALEEANSRFANGIINSVTLSLFLSLVFVGFALSDDSLAIGGSYALTYLGGKGSDNGRSNTSELMPAQTGFQNRIENGSNLEELGTARKYLALSDSLAALLANDAVLMSISSIAEVSEVGNSRGWVYQYFSRQLDTVRIIEVTDGQVKGNGISDLPGSFFPSVDSLDRSFVDSNSALSISEARGGREFRSGNSDFIVTASVKFRISDLNELPCLDVDSISPVWTILYESVATGNELAIFVDGIIGSFAGSKTSIDSAEREVFSAREGLNIAEDSSEGFADDALLIGISSSDSIVVESDSVGKATKWFYSFFSESLNEIASFGVESEQVATTINLNFKGITSGRLIANFIDSDEAIRVAENEGGRIFRAEHAVPGFTTFVNAALVKGIFEQDRSRTAWAISYSSFGGDESSMLLVDSVTGEYLGPGSGTGCEPVGDNIIPGDLNGDEIVNVQDLIRAINMILAVGMPPTQIEVIAADCNQDGAVNVQDLICIINIILGT